MNNDILKQFTFGFELEGYFKKGPLQQLTGEFKEDGSVGQITSVPKTFEAINIGNAEDGEGESDCESCNGNGTWTEDCECDTEYDCRHQHNSDCFTEEDLAMLTPTQLRQVNSGLTLSRSIHTSNCNHECSDHEECQYYACSGDDSYHERECEDCNGTGHIEGAGRAQEYASQKFDSLKTLLDELGKFKSGNNKANYLWNQTCGLHLHIGKKTTNKFSYKQIWNILADYGFLQKLHAEAIGWCECQRKRLLIDTEQGTNYYQFWRSPLELIKTYQHMYPLRDFSAPQASEKFRFLRFHTDYNTLEFRFLCPCQHKVENVEKLIALVTDHLTKPAEYTVERKVSDKARHETLNIPLVIKNKNTYEFKDVPWQYEPTFVERSA